MDSLCHAIPRAFAGEDPCAHPLTRPSVSHTSARLDRSGLGSAAQLLLEVRQLAVRARDAGESHEEKEEGGHTKHDETRNLESECACARMSASVSGAGAHRVCVRVQASVCNIASQCAEGRAWPLSPTPPPMRAGAICSLRRVFACSRLVSPDSSIQPLAHVSRPVVGARRVCGSSARTDTRWMAKPLSQAAGQQRKQAQERDRIRRRGITREQGSHTLTEAGQARMRTLFSPHTAPPFPPSPLRLPAPDYVTRLPPQTHSAHARRAWRARPRARAPRCP